MPKKTSVQHGEIEKKFLTVLDLAVQLYVQYRAVEFAIRSTLLRSARAARPRSGPLLGRLVGRRRSCAPSRRFQPSLSVRTMAAVTKKFLREGADGELHTDRSRDDTVSLSPKRNASMM